MKVLLIDTSFAAQPIYDYLVGAGHDVWTTGNRSQDPLARRAGNRWIEQDYSDVAAVQNTIDSHGIERAVPGCTDVSIATCAELSVSAGAMDSPETVQKLSDKSVFRDLCRDLKLPAPQVLQGEERPVSGTWICKPVDTYSGRGISIFDASDTNACTAALEEARQASPSGRYILEEFVSGQLHSCTGFIENHRLVDVHYVVEGSSVNPYAVDTSYVRYDVPIEAQSVLQNGLEQLSASIGLADGLLHTQFILDGARPYIIECSRRCPGDLYGLLIELSTGLPYAARYASAFIGASKPEASTQHRHILRHTVTGDAEGVFSGLRLQAPLPLLGFYPLQRVGETVLPNQRSRCGLAFFETQSETALAALFDQVLERRAYSVLP